MAEGKKPAKAPKVKIKAKPPVKVLTKSATLITAGKKKPPMAQNPKFQAGYALGNALRQKMMGAGQPARPMMAKPQRVFPPGLSLRMSGNPGAHSFGRKGPR